MSPSSPRQTTMSGIRTCPSRCRSLRGKASNGRGALALRAVAARLAASDSGSSMLGSGGSCKFALTVRPAVRGAHARSANASLWCPEPRVCARGEGMLRCRVLLGGRLRPEWAANGEISNPRKYLSQIRLAGSATTWHLRAHRKRTTHSLAVKASPEAKGQRPAPRPAGLVTKAHEAGIVCGSRGA